MEQVSFDIDTRSLLTLTTGLFSLTRTRPQDTDIPVAVPEGSLMMYSPNVMHRGRAHVLDEDRLIVTLTLMGSNGLVPNGIPLAGATNAPKKKMSEP
jgi:hypothetical protein